MKILKPLTKVFTLMLVAMGVMLFQIAPASAETINYIDHFNSDFSVNAYNPQNYRQVILWQTDHTRSDKDQKWVLNSPAAGMIRQAGSNYCLNAYDPGNYRKVILWYCNEKDNDQKWEWGQTQDLTLIKRKGSEYCLNAYSPQNYREVILWYCNGADPDQQWFIN
jgi:hypothetical protein